MVYSTLFADIELVDDYIHVRFKDQSIIDIYAAKEMARILIKICNGKPHYVITDLLGKYISMSNEARRFFANNEEFISVHKATAILVNKKQTQLLAGFFLKFHKPEFPTKIFTNFDKALDWIRTV